MHSVKCLTANRVVGSSGIGITLLAIASLVGACSTAQISRPSAPPGDILRRHWGQVCTEGEGQTLFRVSQLFDTMGLEAELDAKGLRPRVRGTEEPSVDFLTRYGADGRITARGLWEFTGDSAAADQVGVILGDRARSLPRLLRPEGFHTRLLLYPSPRLELAPTIECMPHFAHTEGDLTLGLPDSVRTWGGERSLALGAGNDSTVAVRLVIDDVGRVIDVAKRRGSERAFGAVLKLIGQLQFDPASRNGEPIVDSLVQSFRFSRGDEGYDEATLDSLWLAARGFFRRAGEFPAIGRLLLREIDRSRPLSERLAAFEGFELREVSDARLAWVGSDGQWAACPANVYVNGSPTRTDPVGEPPEFDMLAASFSVIGVEIYTGPASPVTDSLGCGVILLWSRAAQLALDHELVGSIEGVVVWPEGIDVDQSLLARWERDQGFQVMLEPGGRRVSLRYGIFGIERIPPGRYRLEVQRDGVELWTETVTVVANATANVRVELSSR